MATNRVRPWIRFWARTFDYLIVIAPLALILDAALPIWRQQFFLLYLGVSWVGMVLWIPIEAWALSRYGTTPGKAFLRVRVEGELTFGRALRRAFGVWVKGMGLGLPLIAQLTQFFAYRRLMRSQTTLWDQGLEVIHGAIGAVRALLFIITFLAIEGLTIGFSALFVRGYLVMEEIDLKYP
jgi:RDD family